MQPLPQSEDEIFATALDLPPGPERETFLDQACEGRPELRDRVVVLLQSHSDSDGFLDVSAYGPEKRPVEASHELIGSRIHHYTLKSKLGEGGYGVVYLAEQTFPIRRQVALKVIKMGMDTRAMVARFDAERQVLALLDHPGISRIFEAGTTGTGAPYYVMEFVNGLRITDFCDQFLLTTRKRLELMIQVCQAVQHAHQRGIIHRDLKPSNILVNLLQDGQPVVKIIDFGIAKVLTHRFSEETLTIQGQLLGTPAYMGPEQLESDGMDVDTRTDVYSLGVILHELLTGKAPFELKQDEGLESFRRRATQREPRKPSSTVATLSTEERRQLAEGRQSSFGTLLAMLRGDLDAVVLKALAKDRARRYESAAALARDLDRYLRHEPVEARAPGLIYLAGKFACRHRALSASAVLLALTLILAGGLVLRAWQNENRALRAAAAAADTLRINLYCADMQLASQSFAAGDIGRVRDLLDRHKSNENHRLEWRFFSQLASGEELWNRRIDHEGVQTAGFISEDRFLSFGSSANARVQIIDGNTGAVVGQFGRDGPPITRSTLSPDGTKLMLAMDNCSSRPVNITLN